MSTKAQAHMSNHKVADVCGEMTDPAWNRGILVPLDTFCLSKQSWDTVPQVPSGGIFSFSWRQRTFLCSLHHIWITSAVSLKSPKKTTWILPQSLHWGYQNSVYQNPRPCWEHRTVCEGTFLVQLRGTGKNKLYLSCSVCILSRL